MMEQKLTRRMVLGLLASAGATTLLAACGPTTPAATPDKPTTPPAAPPTAAAGAGAVATVATAPKPAAGQPKMGGTLRVGLQTDLTGLDGHNSNRDTQLSTFDWLVYMEGSQEAKPMLAESWERAPDGKSITWRLRKGVTWHSGREFTSEDVVWNTTRLKDPKLGAGYASHYRVISAVEAPDKYTVIWRSDQAWPHYDYAAITAPQIDPVTMQGPDATKTSVGTGPFTFLEWQPGSKIRLGKNTNYWQSGIPYLDGVDFTIFGDASSMATALEAGSVDMVLNPARRDLARLQQDSKYKVVVNELSGNMLQLIWNVTQAPGDNKQVRQAINYAIDRKRIVEQVLLGIGRPNALPWNPASPAFDAAKNQSYAFDLDKAKSLLASGGSNITFDFNYNGSSPEWGTIGQILQSDLAKIGVTLNLKPADAPTLQQLSNSRSFNGLYAGSQQYGRVPAPAPYYDPVNNWASFKSERFTELHNSLSLAVTPEEQKQAAVAYNDYILDESWAMPIADFHPVALTSQRVEGLTFHMNQRIVYQAAWLA